jgi:tetratricopeptide (TPR) repeat protein
MCRNSNTHLPVRSNRMAGLIVMTVLIVATTSCRRPERHFQKGKELIQANCGECLGATKGGLEQGVSEVNLALEKGYGDKLAAYKLLADAYNTLAVVYSTDRSQEQLSYRDKTQRMYQQAMALDGKDPRLRYEYAMTLHDRTQQLQLLQENIKLDPNFAESHYALGVLLVWKGNLNDAITELQNALRLTDAQHAQSYAKRLIEALNAAGRQSEIPKVMQELQNKTAAPISTERP